MTRKLEELFDLAASLPDSEDNIIQDFPKKLINEDTLDTIEKIEKALPQVRDLSTSEQELDELATMAKDAFNVLLDLGMQTDPRFSAEIFSVSSAMLGHALNAKTAKINKKLKMIDLQLKKADLERKLKLVDIPDEPKNLGVGKVMDRNELLKLLNEETTKNNSNDK